MKKAYSLIELLICISILALMSTFIIFDVDKYNKQMNTIKVKECNFSIASLINSSKLYCRQADKEGKIIFSQENHDISFYCNGKLTDRMFVPDGITLNNVKTPGQDNVIRIDKRGITSDACSISFMDEFSINHYITISVGSTYVEVKE